MAEKHNTMKPSGGMAPREERRALRAERQIAEREMAGGFNHADFLRDVADRDRVAAPAAPGTPGAGVTASAPVAADPAAPAAGDAPEGGDLTDEQKAKLASAWGGEPGKAPATPKAPKPNK